MNIVPIKGLIHFSGKIWTKTSSTGIDANYINVERPLFVFTDGEYSTNGGSFWPFVKMWEADILGYNSYNDDTDMYTGRFKGLFYNYNYKAFIVYLLLGLAIVFLPKIWNGNNDNSKPKALPDEGKVSS